MIVGLLWLLGCQLVGEVVVRLLDVPIPGPVVGMVLLLGVLRVRRPSDEAEQDPIVSVGTRLLAHLQLLFVPAGVGVVAYGATLRDHALPLGVALVVSWVAGLATVAWVVQLLARRGVRP